MLFFVPKNNLDPRLIRIQLQFHRKIEKVSIPTKPEPLKTTPQISTCNCRDRVTETFRIKHRRAWLFEESISSRHTMEKFSFTTFELFFLPFNFKCVFGVVCLFLRV